MSDTEEQRAGIAELIGDVKPATTGLLEQLAQSVRDRREHEHPKWEDLYCLNLVSFMGERMAPVLRRLLDAEARVAELETEREKLVRWHGEDSEAITKLVARIERHRARLVALQNDALSMRGSLAPADGPRAVPFELGETLTPAVDWLIARVAELEAAQGTVFRASHDSIVMGLYTTAAEARKHCEAEERRSWSTGTNLSFDWIEDDEDGVAELVVVAGQNEESTTGYVVEALEVASEYDEGADE